MNLDEQTRTDENRARRQGQQEDLESPQVARLAAGSLVKVHLRAALGMTMTPVQIVMVIYNYIMFFYKNLKEINWILMGYHRISMEYFFNGIS